MGSKKKYFTEEEKIAAKREYDKQRYQKLKEEISKQHSDYYKNNKDVITEKHSEWRKNNPNYMKQYRQKNKDILAIKTARYYAENRDEKLQKQAEYHATQKGRATNLLSSYRYSDIRRKRGECTLTADWIVDNIFTSKCHYCGETDWHKLGCDRIDNSKPHTEDNVLCCCDECNTKRGRKEYNTFIKIIKGKNNKNHV